MVSFGGGISVNLCSRPSRNSSQTKRQTHSAAAFMASSHRSPFSLLHKTRSRSAALGSGCSPVSCDLAPACQKLKDSAEPSADVLLTVAQHVRSRSSV